MKSLLSIVILLLFTISCATHRTPYQPHDDYYGGYSENLSGELKFARFTGNAHTFASDAQLFSHFRAMEICRESEKPVALVVEQLDLSQEKQVQRSSTSGSFIGKTYFGSSSSWVETYTFPTYDTYFVCTDKAYTTNVSFKVITKEDMKLLVKDLKGAVQVFSLNKESPNHGILMEGDIIIKMNGERVEYLGEIVWGLEKAKNKEAIPVVLFREGELLKINIKSREVTDSVLTRQSEIVKSLCQVSEIGERPICTGRNIASDDIKDPRTCTFLDKLNAKHGCALIKISK